MKRILVLFIVAVILSFQPVIAQIVNPVSFKYSVKKVNDKEAILSITANIENGWHLYTQYFPDGGPIRMEFKFEQSTKFKLVGKVTETPKPSEVFDDIFEIKVQYFASKGTFSQKIELLTDKSFTVKGSLEGQACKEDGMCVPVNSDFEFVIDIKAAGNDDLQKKKVIEDSTSLANSNDSIIKIPVANQNTPIKTEVVDSGYAQMSLWAFFITALLGGIVALLTPCIYPMIPMTVSYFMHNSNNRRKSIMQASVYGISIIVIYILIGTIVAVTLGESFTNWLSTHWIPNIFFFIIFVIFAASFFGMFELVLPNWLISKSDKQADKGGYVGAFFMAFTLVLVSFSCTAPIVGTILALSTKGEVIKPIIGMLGFSLAFALPFTLFAIFPTALQKLPKSGGWLNSVKVVLGFIELALGLKFLSVADQTYHWGILDREIYLALWIVIFSLMGLYLLGKLKFHHDSEVKYLGVPRLIFAIITFSFVVYLIPGMFGAPLKALSGWTPPQATHDFDLVRLIRENAGSANTQNTICATPKYADKLHLPHGIKGYYDYQQALACAKEQKKPLFIDFTGHGCVNCREMEANVWSDPQVLKRLNENFVVVALYVDDKVIEIPANEQYTSQRDGKLKTKLGARNADFQVTRFNANAQPYYVLLDNNEQLLKQPRGYNLNVDEFVKFLDDAVVEFKKR